MYTGILDVSHWEYDSLHGRIADALARAKDDGIRVVIAKATQGKDYVDPSWPKWARAVQDAGLVLGAYHFGSNTSPGDQQSLFFLERVMREVDNADRVILALDFERNPTPSRTMSLSDARTWLYCTAYNTERRPLLYGDSSFLSQISDRNDALGEFPLWVAAYGNRRPRIPPAWRRDGWTLWQYTDGPFGPDDQVAWPRRVAGFPSQLDRSAYEGTLQELCAGLFSGGES